MFLDGHNRWAALLRLFEQGAIGATFPVDLKVVPCKDKDDFVRKHDKLNTHVSISPVVRSTIADSGFAKYITRVVSESFNGTLTVDRVHKLLSMSTDKQLDILSDMWRRNKWAQAYRKLMKATAPLAAAT